MQYRVLCKQFVLRVIDLEALSVQADIPRYLGQFGGVLLMLGFLHTVFVYAMGGVAPWFVEQYLERTMMLVAGFVSVVCWEQMFPDRRDVMVLGVLPIRPAVILAAKVSSTAGLLLLAVLCLNAGPGLLLPLILGARHETLWGFFQAEFAFWFTMVAVSAFLYCSALAVQGLMALVLPRRAVLSLSSLVQIAIFTTLLVLYFLEPSVHAPRELVEARGQQLLAWSPLYWFVAILNQMNSSLPPELNWLAWRGWLALGCAVFAAGAALVLAYLRTMRRVVEQPDLIPARRTRRSSMRGGALSAMLLFSVRSLLRSRHHRAIYAFYVSLVIALGLSCLRDAVSTARPHPVSTWFLGSTVLMMSLVVVGLRGVASMPVTLNANWVLRLTQMESVHPYLSAGRILSLLVAVAPVLSFVAGIGALYRPLQPVAAHLFALAAAGWLFVELTMLGTKKAPFACSFLPGKSNVQARFWTFVIAMLPLTRLCGVFEQRAMRRPVVIWEGAAVLLLAAVAVWRWNRSHEKTSVLQFEESEPEVVTVLGLGSLR